MAYCRYCGEDAGFLRSVHAECQRQKEAAEREIVRLIARQGTKPDGFKYLSKEIHKLAAASFIGETLLNHLVIEGWGKVAHSTLKQSYIDEGDLFALLELAERLGIAQAKIAQSKINKLIFAGWQRIANSRLNRSQVDESNLFALLELAQRLGIPQATIAQAKISDSLLAAWQRVANSRLERSHSDESDFFAFLELAQRLGSRQAKIDNSVRGANIGKEAALQDTHSGGIPEEFILHGQNPFNLQK